MGKFGLALLLARRIVEEGWPIVRAAEHSHVAWPTAKRWAVRYAEMGEAGIDSARCPRPLPSESALPYRHSHRRGHQT
jgi:leucine-zipper of insertion element IS481